MKSQTVNSPGFQQLAPGLLTKVNDDYIPFACYTVNLEIFVLQNFHVKLFRVKIFSWFQAIHENIFTGDTCTIQHTHECERASCVREKVASCCSNATMVGVLADFNTKDRTVRLVRPLFPFGGAAVGPSARLR